MGSKKRRGCRRGRGQEANMFMIGEKGDGGDRIEEGEGRREGDG